MAQKGLAPPRLQNIVGRIDSSVQNVVMIQPTTSLLAKFINVPDAGTKISLEWQTTGLTWRDGSYDVGHRCGPPFGSDDRGRDPAGDTGIGRPAGHDDAAQEQLDRGVALQ